MRTSLGWYVLTATLVRAPATKTFELTEVPDNYRHRLLAQYDREAFAGSSFATDILMYLDASKVLALRKEFLSKDDGLSMHEFVFVMKSFLMGGTLDADNGMANMSETVLVSNLCELFEQVRFFALLGGRSRRHAC